MNKTSKPFPQPGAQGLFGEVKANFTIEPQRTENLNMLEDNNFNLESLRLYYSDAHHNVESIINHKVDEENQSSYEIMMCCQCCNGWRFWVSESCLLANGCGNLKNLVFQVKELHQLGIEIQSN